MITPRNLACKQVSYFCAVLFPVNLVTKQVIIEGGQKSVFSSNCGFSTRQAQSIGWSHANQASFPKMLEPKVKEILSFHFETKTKCNLI